MKKCPKCLKTKELSCFNRDKRKKDGLNYDCRECSVKRKKEYDKTISGVITMIFNSQTNSHKKRKSRTEDMLPIYTKQEFTDWLLKKTNFEFMYEQWKLNGYKSDIKPSVDRINPNNGYSFDNLEIMTWKDNREKGYLDKSTGIDKRNIKAVVCLSKDGEVINKYFSIAEAVRQTGVPSGHISRVCNGHYGFKSAGGFIWRYSDD